MENLFHSYWWLMFPLGWFIYAAWTSWLNYRRQRQALDIVRRYADSGREIPSELMKVLDRPIDSETEFWNGGDGTGRPSSAGGGHLYTMALFAALAAAFGYSAWRDLYGNGEAFTLVAFIMGALALASLVSLIFRPRRRD